MSYTSLGDPAYRSLTSAPVTSPIRINCDIVAIYFMIVSPGFRAAVIVGAVGIIMASAANGEDAAGEHILAWYPGEGEESGQGGRWPPTLLTLPDDIAAGTEVPMVGHRERLSGGHEWHE